MDGIKYGTKRLIFSFIARGSYATDGTELYPLANLVSQRTINPLKFSIRADYLFSSFIAFKLIPPFKSSTDYFTVRVVRGRYNFKTLLKNSYSMDSDLTY